MVQKRYTIFIIYMMVLLCFLLGLGCTESGSPPISETSGITPGQNVTIGFTVLDAAKRPVITTEKQIFTSAYEKGDLVFFSDLIRIPSNTTSGIDIVKLPVSHPGINGTTTFAIFGPELDAISYGIVGMKPGETKIITNPMGTNLERTIDNEKFPGIVGNEFADAKIGDQVPIAFSETPIIAVDDAVIQVPLRTATILDRNETGVTISYGYPFIELYLKDTGL